MNNLTITGQASDRTVYYGATELNPAPSRELYNHSPDGFSWGYGGSGPAQLALAILLEHTQDVHVAASNYQQFKFDVIAHLPIDQDFEIPISSVDEWLASHRA